MSDGVVPNLEAINRLRCGLPATWTEVAERAGISSVTLARLRRGDPLSVRTVRRIAAALHVEACKIVAGPEPVSNSARSACA